MNLEHRANGALRKTVESLKKYWILPLVPTFPAHMTLSFIVQQAFAMVAGLAIYLASFVILAVVIYRRVSNGEAVDGFFYDENDNCDK